MSEVTRILSAIEQGDAHAAEQLLPLVYDELRRLAADKMMQERPGQTLQATALVHEAYLRLVANGGCKPPEQAQRWDGRGHFFAAAAEAMRRILVEQARRKGRLKRGRNHKRVDLDDLAISAQGPSDDMVALDEALTKLAQKHAKKAELVKLRYFAGFTVPKPPRRWESPPRLPTDTGLTPAPGSFANSPRRKKPNLVRVTSENLERPVGSFLRRWRIAMW